MFYKHLLYHFTLCAGLFADPQRCEEHCTVAKFELILHLTGHCPRAASIYRKFDKASG